MENPTKMHASEIDHMMQGGRIDEAERALLTAGLVDDIPENIFERLARICEAREDFDQAILQWDKCQQANPHKNISYICKTDILRSTGKIDAAQLEIEKISHSVYKDFDVCRCCLRLACAKRDLPLALNLSRHIARHNDSLDIRLQLIDILIEMQNIEAAFEEIEQSIGLYNKTSLIMERLARALMICGAWDDSLSILNIIIKSKEASNWVLYQALWYTTELRRFDHLESLEQDITSNYSANSSIIDDIHRAKAFAKEFRRNKKLVSLKINEFHNLNEKIDYALRLLLEDDSLADAAAWSLFELFPHNFSVLSIMADPPLTPRSQHRSAYFRREIYLKYPSKEKSLEFYISNLFSRRAFHEVARHVEFFNLDFITDAKIAQIYITSCEIIGKTHPHGEKLLFPNVANKDWLEMLNKRSVKVSVARSRTQQRKIINKKELKIALCISGQLRGYSDCLPSMVENISSKYRCDTFVQTWEIVGNAYGNHGGRLQRMLPASVAEQVPVRWSDQDFIKAYPTAGVLFKSHIRATKSEVESYIPHSQCEIENENLFDSMYSEDLEDWSAVKNGYKLFFQMSKVISRMQEHAKQNGSYDIVVWTRPDIIIPRFNIDEIIEECLNKNFVLTSFFPPLCVGDFTLVGSPHNMAHLANIWRDIVARRSYKDKSFCVQGTGPTLLCNHLFASGINVKGTDMFVDHTNGPKGAKPRVADFLECVINDILNRSHTIETDQGVLASLMNASRVPVDDTVLHAVNQKISQINTFD